jgi:hypothetical protein
MSLNGKIIVLNEDITSFVDHEKQLTSSHFLKFISTLKKFDYFTQHLQEEEEVKQNSTEYDFLWKQEVKPQLQVPPAQPQP